MIRPIPAVHGVGFFSNEQLPEYAGKYREEQVGRFWNYYVTADCQDWPEKPAKAGPFVIDGFSPNLNKSLHVGHLRQLALAKSLHSLLNGGQTSVDQSKFVALLGASQGVFEYAVTELNEWFDFVNYHPTLHYDVLMPRDEHIVPRYKKMMPYKSMGTDINGKPFEHEQECTVWDGPNGSVIVERWDGRPTYAFADLAFAKTVGPTHYITGAEQKEHFQSLGLGDKHLAMGLVLGADGKKMKSRTGDGVTAKELLEEIKAKFDPTPYPDRLAWNVVAWNFLHVSRGQNVKFNAEEWTKYDAPGMYITYTYARLKSALKPDFPIRIDPAQRKALDKNFDAANYLDHDQHLRVQQSWLDAVPAWSKENPDPHYDLTQADIDLLGFAGQYVYHKNSAVAKLDPATLANYTYELAGKLGTAYHSEKVQGGRYGFGYALDKATFVLRRCMSDLGMFSLEIV